MAERWIPVEERLPDDGAWVLVSLRAPEGALPTPWVARWDDRYRCWHGGAETIGAALIAAWQPLPAPYDPASTAPSPQTDDTLARAGERAWRVGDQRWPLVLVEKQVQGYWSLRRVTADGKILTELDLYRGDPDELATLYEALGRIPEVWHD